MKVSKLIVSLLGCAMLVTGCGETAENGENNNQNNNSENNNNNNKNNKGLDAEEGVVSIDDIIVEEEEKEEPLIEKTCEEISRGMCGGSLTDLLVGSYIEPSATYTCSFSHDKSFTGKYTVKSDDRTVAQVTHDANSNSFVIKGITPGDAIIQAVSDLDEIVLQFVVHCRKRIPINQIGKELYKVDKFTGMGYGYKLTFLSDNPLKGTLVGSDDFEESFVNFKLIDGVEEKIGNGTDFNTYKFKISVDTENSVTQRTYTDMYVATTGEKIYMYYSNGLVDIFTSYGLSIYSGSWN